MELKAMEAVHDFTDHKYVIDMMDPKDWVRHYNEGGEVVNDFVLPRGPRQKDEFSDTVYHAGTDVPYHWHAKGVETFEIAKGSVDCVVGDRHFIAKAGDLIHLPPYTGHGFVFLEEGTIWRELFQEIDMSGGILEKNMVNAYYADMKENDEFMAMYRGGKSMHRETPAAWKKPAEDHSAVFQCRTPEFAWAKYEGEGYAIQLKVCKFETGGCKEIWHADVKKGLTVEYAYPHKGYELLYVKSGKLELTVCSTHANAQPQTYIVTGDHIIDIPPYHTYTIKVLEDGDLYNYGGEYDLQACLADLESVKQSEPERVATKEGLLAFLRYYGVYATSLTYIKG
ncbi:MAG: cupin domain-containing protein [Eubacteriales bacterium]|nr:cupin domain-containing protein [Eubacteriales bacterium]